MSESTAAPSVASPRLRRLLSQVRARGDSALERFWREVADEGAPLVEGVAGAPEERLVTVVWRQDRPVEGVYLLANRVTDKHLAPRGMMRRLDGTDLWYVSLRLPLGLRCSYRIHPFTADDPHITSRGPRRGTARGLPDDRSDPLNHRAGGPFGSMIELDGAPSLTEWHTEPHPAPGTDTFGLLTADGTTYRVRRFVPVTGSGTEAGTRAGTEPAARLPLLVLLDGEKWFDQYGVTSALTAAVAAGRIPPMAVLGIEAGADTAQRMRQLGANPRFIDALADEVVPAVTADLPGWAGPRRTILCGQSLGGLTALAAALRRPTAFGTVLAHSASTWWRPGMNTRPQELESGRDTWLHEQAAAVPVGEVSIRMDVGSNEGTILDDMSSLHALMSARGFTASLNVYSGGHDHCCWAAALVDGLAATCAEWHTSPV
ncbi:alpha/beta hydrolase-fold protein [Streptomyces sp. CA-249302]|uniref:alpha/beta hydrolase-fold protein n=1 Tax=Streptomyces sp. CA-249302 TaxID=3240058 RepID=UPI003D8C602B